jgi:hypothetical protein
MKLQLNIKDRIIIQGTIIKEGGLIELTIAQSIMDAIKFTPKEISKYQLKEDKGATVWNPEKDENIDLQLTNEQIEVLKKSVKIIDEGGRVQMSMVDTFNKINSL